MRLTLTQLRRIIKEEVSKSMSSVDNPFVDFVSLAAYAESPEFKEARAAVVDFISSNKLSPQEIKKHMLDAGADSSWAENVSTWAGSSEEDSVSWDSTPVAPGDFPEEGYTSSGELSTIEDWLDSIAFKTPQDRARVERRIDKKFELLSRSDELAGYDSWRVTVVLTPDARGNYNVNFMTSD